MANILGKVIPKWVLALITVLSITSTVVALELFSQYKISYVIQPAVETPTLTPNPVMLDLGNIPSGSTGEKDFGNTATLSLPAGYEITFELDTATVDDFDSFTTSITIYEAGTTNYIGCVTLGEDWPPSSDSRILDAGEYDLYIEISYTAKSVTTETSGEVIINISWPG